MSIEERESAPVASETPAQIVARKLLSFYAGDESRWTKGASARAADGVVVSSSSDEASCFCVSGAYSCTNIAGAWNDFVRACETATGGLHIIDFNDRATTAFADVVAVLERVAAGEAEAAP
jgi:hypothetical protein